MWLKDFFQNEAFSEDKLSKKNFTIQSDPPKSQKCRGISENKKDDILKLIESFPAVKKSFDLT